MSEDELREASRAQWSGVAEGWAGQAGRREEGPAGVAADWMLEAARLGPGDRVLELASGAGDVGLRAAELVGSTGLVVCSDFAEPMVEVVRERANAPGLGHVEGRVLDAEDLALGDGERFNAVLCRFGYMLMADPGRALLASRGALRPGGRLALAVWGPAESNPWLSLLTDAVMAVLSAPPPSPGMPGPFALGDQERLTALLEEAGFADVVVQQLDTERRHESLEEWWAGTQEVSGPISSVVSHMSEEQVAAMRERALEGARLYVLPDGGVRFPARIVVASATR